MKQVLCLLKDSPDFCPFFDNAFFRKMLSPKQSLSLAGTADVLDDAPNAFQECRLIPSLEVCTMTTFGWLRKINENL